MTQTFHDKLIQAVKEGQTETLTLTFQTLLKICTSGQMCEDVSSLIWELIYSGLVVEASLPLYHKYLGLFIEKMIQLRELEKATKPDVYLSLVQALLHQISEGNRMPQDLKRLVDEYLRVVRMMA